MPIIKNNLLIITGYSGSGKTTISNILEDIGYHCIDNLPIELFSSLAKLLQKGRVEELTKVALVIDIRDKKMVKDFPKIYNNLKNKGMPIEIIFLDSSDKALYLRYKRTRRPHPLAKENLSLEESIKTEKRLLEPIKDIASYVIDTSDKTPQDLKKTITDIAGIRNEKTSFFITFESFGFLHKIPERSDLVFDVRSLPNPYYIDTYKNKTGKDKEVKDFLMKSTKTKECLKATKKYLDYFIEEAKNDRYYVTISVGCTGGKHRSVVIVDELSNYFLNKGYKINIIHKDIMK